MSAMMSPNQGNYMDPQSGYMKPTLPRHPIENPYDLVTMSTPHYYANGSQFQEQRQQKQQPDPYFYSPARTQQPHLMQQQQQQPAQQHYHQPQGYGTPPPAKSPHGYATPKSAADQTASFRLHPTEMAAEPVVVTRSPAQSKEVPEWHRGFIQQPKQEQRQSAIITRSGACGSI